MKKILSWCFGSLAHLVALQKLVQAITGLVTAFLVTKYLSINEQGYFYTIGSLLSSYILLDFGLSNLLVQVSARYFSDFKWDGVNVIASKPKLGSDFFGLTKWTVNWYLKLGILTLILIPAGFLYFLFSNNTNEVAWQLPWIAVVCSLALSMPATGFLAILEGAGQIQNVYTIRIGHYLFGALCAWFLLFIGKGLYAQSMAPLAVALIVYCWVWTKFPSFLKNVFNNKEDFPWKRDLWPQQKKVGVSWISNYLFLHVPVPIVFYFSGAADAGKMGLSMVIANVACAIAMSWVTAVTPQVSSLVAQRNVSEAQIVFKKALGISVLLLVVGTFTFHWIQNSFEEYTVAQRILSPYQTVLIFVTFAAFHAINALIVYFRAFKQEPLALPSLISTLTILLVGCIIVPQTGVSQLIVLMAVIYSLLIIYSLLVFMRFDSERLVND